MIEDELELIPSTESITPEDKQKRLAELREWRRQIEVESSPVTGQDEIEQIDKIEEEIRKLEQS